MATGRLRVVGARRAEEAADGHALIASNGPSDGLTRDVPSGARRLPAAAASDSGRNEDLSAR